MRKKLLYILAVIALFVPTAQAGEQIIETDYDYHSPTVLKSDSEGELWAAYYDTTKRIHVRNLTSGRDILVTEKEKVSSGLALDLQGENVYVVWREKGGGIKRIYFRALTGKEKILHDPVLLDENTTEALSRIEVDSNAKGDIFVTWYGERGTNKSMYNIYGVASNDFGKTFSEPLNLTSDYNRSIYPTILVDDENAYVFAYVRKADKYFMVFRKTTDRGKTWTEPVEITEIGVVTLFIEPMKIGDRLHVFWFNTYDDPVKQTPVIEGAYSDNGGMNWKTTRIQDTEGIDLSIMDMDHDSRGNIYLVVSGQEWVSKKQKEKVYFFRSADNGETWEKALPLRHYPFHNTTATKPTVLAGKDSEVVAVWVDYRNIRSNLYMQFSKDDGKTWQGEDIALEIPGKYNTLYWPYEKNIVQVKDRFYFLGHRFQTDNTTIGAQLLLIDFLIDNGGRK